MNHQHGELGQSEQMLNLDGSGLELLPEDIGRWTQPRTLSVYQNALTELPAGVWRLGRLETLNLAANRFEAIAEEIGALARLRMLDPGHNRLTSARESQPVDHPGGALAHGGEP